MYEKGQRLRWDMRKCDAGGAYKDPRVVLDEVIFIEPMRGREKEYARVDLLNKDGSLHQPMWATSWETLSPISVKTSEQFARFLERKFCD